jgi:hypothetical protein
MSLARTNNKTCEGENESITRILILDATHKHDNHYPCGGPRGRSERISWTIYNLLYYIVIWNDPFEHVFSAVALRLLSCLYTICHCPVGFDPGLRGNTSVRKARSGQRLRDAMKNASASNEKVKK